MSQFSPERSDAIRAGLIDGVAATVPRRRRTVWAAGLVLAGVLAGAGASAGAFAATGLLSPVAAPAFPEGRPTPAVPDAVVAPEGVIPGAPITTLFDEPTITLPFDSETEVSLADRPVGATHARVTVSALTAGSVVFGMDPGGNNPSSSWTQSEVTGPVTAYTWLDFPLDESVDTLYIQPRGLEGIVTVQYVTQIPTLLNVNENGESYGAMGTAQGEPDLVSVVGEAPDGSFVDGYVRSEDLNAFSPEHPGQPKNPKQALQWQDERSAMYPNGWDLPVYEPDGVTQIGVFHVG
ncbi:hypothetical protein [Microbacterium sp. HJ5]